ncbi:photosystem II reaction center protein J (plasmid) [Lactiplantibacillus pentosus]|nr:photosystem II reaction center protein J [Lactiplantibacillus pentosus]WFC04972.1 photosystem II reaction center protein J [Lactiplantibacillus pentosus]
MILLEGFLFEVIGTVAGILVIGLIGIFFYGSYSGLGSSL